MKGIFIILDGLGDLPHPLLEGKTPLEVADMPNLGFLANRGEMGTLYPVKPGFIPSSDEAIISIFGNSQISSSRGQLEARGAGIKTVRGDLALRVNFATIDPESGAVIDRRVGRTLSTKEASSLVRALNDGIDLPIPFVFDSTIQHRGVLVFRGGFSDNISDNDISNYVSGRLKQNNSVNQVVPLDDEENSQYTAKVVNEFIYQAKEILIDHPINKEREKKGLMPANFLLVRDAGIEVPNLKLYSNWMSVAYMPLEIGFSEISGMKTFTFDYPKLKGFDVYRNLYDGLRLACKYSIRYLKKNYKKFDYAYIHFKETDLPGHDNKPLEKKEMLEYIDKTFFKFLRKFAPQNEIKIVVTGDHSTPCKLKAHSSDPVPVLFYNASIPREKKFCEREAKRGSLGRIIGNELFKVVGFSK